MAAVRTHQSATVATDGAFTAWLRGFGRAIRGERSFVTSHEAAKALGRAAAEARARKELTLQERRTALHDRLKAELAAGFVGGVRR